MRKKIAVVRKVSDVGTSEPWSARMWFGILQIRDHALKAGGRRGHPECEEKSRAFDKIYRPLLDNLGDAYKTLTNLEKLIIQHEKDLLDNKVLRIDENQHSIEHPIDQEVKILFRAFVNSLATALKQTQHVCKFIDESFDLGFLFATNDINFSKKVSTIEKQNGDFFGLLPMIKSFRPLSNEIIVFNRNPIEHPNDGFVLPDIEYDFEQKKISSDFYSQKKLQCYWENTWRFCEIMVVNAFALKIKYPWGIVEIPQKERDPDMPIKYKPWIIDDKIFGKIQEHIANSK